MQMIKNDMEYYITGYSMRTVAGNEQDFQLNNGVGYTSSVEHDWTTCINKSSLFIVCDTIAQVIDKAIKKATLDINSNKIISLVIASNFFETAFWENNDTDSIKSDNNYIARFLQRTYKINGTIICNSTACSSGANTVVTACQLIQNNKTDVVMVVGYDVETEIPKNGMRTIGALSKDKIAPFSNGRTGTDLADGIGAVVIESYEYMKSRGGQHVAKIVGYGVFSDGYNITSPEPYGISLEKAMNKSILMAGIKPTDIQYINAHGSGTKLNDELETRTIKNVFGEHAYNLLVNSSKSLIGHTLGAAGLIELILTIMQMNNGKVHPTANFISKDLDCDLEYCFDGSVNLEIKYAISNSIGFGGTNVSILVEKGDCYDG